MSGRPVGPDTAVCRGRTVTISAPWDGADLPVTLFERPGAGTPVVYLSGLGSTRADFVGATGDNGLPGRPLIAFDWPGSGGTPYPETRQLGMRDLSAFARAVLDSMAVSPVTLIGHSMGGLVALLLADETPTRVTQLINVEGNLAPEDCGVFSRAAVAAARDTFIADGLERLAGELSASGRTGYADWAAGLVDRVRPAAFHDYCTSIVQWSDEAPLLEQFLALRMPRLFVHGEDNSGLSYLAQLARNGVQVASIPGSDHFPARTNRAAFYDAIRRFLEATEPAPPDHVQG